LINFKEFKFARYEPDEFKEFKEFKFFKFAKYETNEFKLFKEFDKKTYIKE